MCGNLPARRLSGNRVSVLSSPRVQHCPFQYRNNLSLASCTTQSNPVSRFSPVMALQGTTTQRWVKIRSRSNDSMASSLLIPPTTSVLLRKTRRLAPAKRFDIVSDANAAYGIPHIPLPRAILSTRPCSPRFVVGLWHPPPR